MTIGKEMRLFFFYIRYECHAKWTRTLGTMSGYSHSIIDFFQVCTYCWYSNGLVQKAQRQVRRRQVRRRQRGWKELEKESLKSRSGAFSGHRAWEARITQQMKSKWLSWGKRGRRAVLFSDELSNFFPTAISNRSCYICCCHSFPMKINKYIWEHVGHKLGYRTPPRPWAE